MIKICILVGLLILGQLQRIETPGLPAIYIHEVVIALYAFSLRKMRIPTPVLAFFGALALSLVVNFQKIGDGIVEAGLYLMRVLLYGSLVFSLRDIVTKAKTKTGESALTLLAAGLGIGGIAQYIVYPDARSLVLLGWDNHLYRAIGTLYDPNFLGLMMVLGIVFFTSLQKKDRVPLVLVAGVCLALTYSRASFVSLGVVGLLWAVKTKKWRELALAITLGAIVLVALPQRGGEGNLLLRSSSLSRRAESNQKAIEIVKKNPLFGIGFNAYKQFVIKSDSPLPSHPSAPDNSFLFILATSGVVGMTAFLYLARWLLIKYQKDTVFIASLTAIGVHSLFNNSLFYPWVMVWVAFLLVRKRSSYKA